MLLLLLLESVGQRLVMGSVPITAGPRGTLMPALTWSLLHPVRATSRFATFNPLWAPLFPKERGLLPIPLQALLRVLSQTQPWLASSDMKETGVSRWLGCRHVYFFCTHIICIYWFLLASPLDMDKSASVCTYISEHIGQKLVQHLGF